MSKPSSPAPGLRLPAPGATGGPGGPWPRLDDHLVAPENEERAEIIDGHTVHCMAGNPEHSGAQANLTAVLRVVAAPGYTGHVELLTRSDVDQDFAADACILRDGKDEATNTRYLEELAFEVINEQSLATATRKAERLSHRGVRRVFGLFVKEGKVKEWRGAWELLTEPITDPCLRLPLLPQALLEGADGELLMARALIAKGNPEIEKYSQARAAQGYKDGEAKGHKDGEAKGLALAILSVLSARGLVISEDQRSRIGACGDIATLTAWIARAALVSDANDLLG